MKHTECKDCKLREYEDCGYHHRIDGVVNCDIPSLSSCDKYGNCMFFQPKPKTKRNSKRPQGEWTIKYINGCSYYICSVCKEMHIDKGNFCPNCGADMRGKEE